jgi:hypothetical protein
MNDELKRIWKEAVVAYLRYYPGICPEGLKKTRKTSVKRAGVSADIRKEPLTNKSRALPLG